MHFFRLLLPQVECKYQTLSPNPKMAHPLPKDEHQAPGPIPKSLSSETPNANPSVSARPLNPNTLNPEPYKFPNPRTSRPEIRSPTTPPPSQQPQVLVLMVGAGSPVKVSQKTQSRRRLNPPGMRPQTLNPLNLQNHRILKPKPESCQCPRADPEHSPGTRFQLDDQGAWWSCCGGIHAGACGLYSCVRLQVRIRIQASWSHKFHS